MCQLLWMNSRSLHFWNWVSTKKRSSCFVCLVSIAQITYMYFLWCLWFFDVSLFAKNFEFVGTTHSPFYLFIILYQNFHSLTYKILLAKLISFAWVETNDLFINMLPFLFCYWKTACNSTFNELKVAINELLQSIQYTISI